RRDRVAHVLDDRVHRHARSDLAGVMSAHAIGDDAQAKRLVEAETILIRLPNSTFFGYAVRSQHATPLNVPWVSVTATDRNRSHAANASQFGTCVSTDTTESVKNTESTPPRANFFSRSITAPAAPGRSVAGKHSEPPRTCRL